KLLDFGLARHFRNRLTIPGTMLGTVDYVAPEQVRDSSSVDIRADIYSLGGTLSWCLTGRTPFGSEGDPTADLARRLSQPPPFVRTWQPKIPAALEALVRRMMAVDPDDRYATPEAVMRSLIPFLKVESGDAAILSAGEPASDHELVLAENAEI